VVTWGFAQTPMADVSDVIAPFDGVVLGYAECLARGDCR